MTVFQRISTGVLSQVLEMNQDVKMLSLRLIVVCLFLPLVVNAGNPEDYRFPREPGTTEDGFPLALSGVPITKTPVIANPGVKVKDYPEHYIPGKETLAKDEMRITACGSWGPAPMRIGQGASCLLVRLGNGDSFIFDIGGGTVGNLFALGVHPAELDKVFITHFPGSGQLAHEFGLFYITSLYRTS